LCCFAPPQFASPGLASQALIQAGKSSFITRTLGDIFYKYIPKNILDKISRIEYYMCMKSHMYIILVIIILFLSCKKETVNNIIPEEISNNTFPEISSQDIIIELVETDVELNFLNKRIDELTNEIKIIIKDEAKMEIFNSQCGFWLREKNNCRNQSGYNYGQLVSDSLKETFIQRIIILENIITDQDYIIREASKYIYIDPWYLKMFENDYFEKEIFLFGSLSINKSEIISGKITGFDEKKTEIDVLFYGGTSDAIMLLYDLLINDKSVVSHFRGKIGFWNGKICINIRNDILGNY
jgi:hypothetical protein